MDYEKAYIEALEKAKNNLSGRSKTCSGHIFKYK